MAITLPTKKSQAAKAKKLKASEKKFQDKVKRMKAQGKAKKDAFLKKSGITRMTQDALHPAEMKGKPHQSQKAIKASRKKKAAQMKTAEDTKAKAKATAKPKAKRKVYTSIEARSGLRPTVEEKWGDITVVSPARQGKRRTAIRNIRASDVDKERSARMVSKKAEKARAKNKKIATGTKAKSAAYKQTKPAATQTAIDRKFSPFGKLSPRAAMRSAASKTIDMFRGEEGKAEADRARKDAQDEVKNMKHGGPVKKDQGYNARLDESMGARNKTKRQQSLKSRRHESEAMEKKGGRRKYAAVKTMDKGRRTKKKPRGVGAALRGWGKAHHG